MNECGFDEAWRGKCKEPAEEGCRCDKHKDEVCASCGTPATHSCYETGQFVCGVSLCDDCEHTTYPDGTNGGIGFNQQSLPEGMKVHCKKTEQKFEPWYARKETVNEIR